MCCCFLFFVCLFGWLDGHQSLHPIRHGFYTNGYISILIHLQVQYIITLIYQDTIPVRCLFVLLPTCISRLCVLIRGCQSLFRACHLHLLKIVRWACHLHLLKRVRWGCHLHLVNRVRWGCHLHVVAHPILSLKGRWWPPPSYFKGWGIDMPSPSYNET